MTLRRSLTTAVAAAALVVVAGCGNGEDDTAAEEPQDDAPAAEETTDDAGAAEDETTDEEGTDDAAGGEEGSFTLAEVEENASPESCWATIDGTVYDLTDWIGQHPGGEERIENLCGTDATEAFSGQHGGQSGPEGQLAEFEIGTLSE